MREQHTRLMLTVMCGINKINRPIKYRDVDISEESQSHTCAAPQWQSPRVGSQTL